MDLTGKEPLVDSASEWLRTPSSEGRRSSGERRRRRRRRLHKRSDIRARIRLRMWIVSTGALIAMVIALYLALGRERPAESGLHLVSGPATLAAIAASATTPPPA